MKTHHICVPNVATDLEYRIGSNAAENSALIQKSSPDDLWFHLDGMASAHVLVTPPSGLSKKQKQTVIKWGATLCKKHSRVHHDSRVSVVYTTVARLRLTDTPGMVVLDGSEKKMVM